MGPVCLLSQGQFDLGSFGTIFSFSFGGALDYLGYLTALASCDLGKGQLSFQ